jgi:hypothetical protein
MTIDERYQSDVEAILSHRYDLGYDFWTTADKRLQKGSPFTIFEGVQYLLELGVTPDEPVLKHSADLIFSVWQPDGKFKVYPEGTIYPCHTAVAAQTLCQLGYASDDRLNLTFKHLLGIQHSDGGWRCSKFLYGHGPETEHSNPGPTLGALNAFRFSEEMKCEAALDRAVDFLLDHWNIRTPIGPCHYGIGSLFMQVEYPFRSYNLFNYVYVLSFYDRARGAQCFHEALQALEAKLVNGQIVVERVVPKLAILNFCKKGAPSELATRRYREILNNLRAKPYPHQAGLTRF